MKGFLKNIVKQNNLNNFLSLPHFTPHLFSSLNIHVGFFGWVNKKVKCLRAHCGQEVVEYGEAMHIIELYETEPDSEPNGSRVW